MTFPHSRIISIGDDIRAFRSKVRFHRTMKFSFKNFIILCKCHSMKERETIATKSVINNIERVECQKAILLMFYGKIFEIFIR